MLDGLVDIWLPDFKYVSPDLSARYSFAPDYFDVASAGRAGRKHQPTFKKPPAFAGGFCWFRVFGVRGYLW